MKRVGFDEEFIQAFQDNGFTVGEQAVSLKALELWPQRRTGIVLGSSLCILASSVFLTLTGMIAALWHIAWWIGVAFFVMVMISQGLVIGVIATSQPPHSEEEQEQ